MQFVAALGRWFWLRVTLFRLRLAYKAFGIEAVNGELLRRTRGTRQVLTSFGAQIDPTARVHGPLLVHNADPDYSNLTVGKEVHLGRGVFLDLSAPVVIRDRAVVAMQTMILTHADAGDRPAASNLTKRRAPVELRPDAYIGARALILPGVTIGEGCVVGAGAVVVRDVPTGMRVAGVPARPLNSVEP